MKEENPPAFPRDERYNGHNGMMLRDYFAAKAMQAMMSNPDFVLFIGKEASKRGVDANELFAKAAYEAADALLKERNKNG